MNISKTALIGFTALLLTASAAQAQDHTYDAWDQNYIVQALLGAVQYENLKIKVEGENAEIDLSLIPQIGAGWGTLPKGDRFQYGLECSFLLGFMVDNISFTSSGGGTTVRVSADMWMFDLAGGPYASLFLDKNSKVRVYAAAGPLLTYANYTSEREEEGLPGVDNNESVFGLGLYARTGIEFRIYDAGMLGLGVRGSWASVDLSDVGGSTDLTGLAAFISFTAGL
jgi:hypothetical protein